MTGSGPPQVGSGGAGGAQRAAPAAARGRGAAGDGGRRRCGVHHHVYALPAPAHCTKAEAGESRLTAAAGLRPSQRTPMLTDTMRVTPPRGDVGWRKLPSKARSPARRASPRPPVQRHRKKDAEEKTRLPQSTRAVSWVTPVHFLRDEAAARGAVERAASARAACVSAPAAPPPHQPRAGHVGSPW